MLVLCENSVNRENICKQGAVFLSLAIFLHHNVHLLQRELFSVAMASVNPRNAASERTGNHGF